MKKHLLQKTLAIALTAVMSLGLLTACGGGSGDPTDSNSGAGDTTTVATDGTTKKPEETEDKDPVESEEPNDEGLWEAFSETVSLKIPVYDRGVEGVPNVSDNYWTACIQEHFGDTYNVEVTFEPITRTDVMTDYALLASGGDLPTLLMEYDYPKLSQWANDGYLTTFDMDAFKEIAPDYYARMEEQGQLQYSEMNGETYFALAYRPFYDTGYTFQTFVRMDWLEEVGYDHVPATHAEYLDAMKKIQDAGLSEHPAGGSMVTGIGSDQNYAFRTYPQDELEWAMYGDVNIPALGWAPNEALVRRENEKYNLGILNPEYYITDSETDKANFINGTTYNFGGYISSNMDWLTAFYDQNPDAKLAIAPAGQVDEEGGTVPAYRADNPFGMIIGFSSSASEDEIKAAWMYMEWMTQEENLFTMQWGIEGENYNIGDNDLPVSVSDYSGDYTQGFNSSKDYWCVTIEAKNAGTIEDIIRANTPQDLPQNFTDDIIDFYYKRVEQSEEGLAINDAIFAVILEAEGEYRGSLTELYKEYRDQLTMCAPEEFDALYDELTQKYLDAGFQEILDARAAAYEAGDSTKLAK